MLLLLLLILHRGLDRFRARVAVVHLVRPLHGRDARQPLRQRDHVFVIKVRAGHVDEPRGLILDRPDLKGRVAILKVHVKGKPLDKSVNLEELARRSPGFSGADLANLMNEAAILAARRSKRSVGMDEFAEALDRVMAGPQRKSRLITEAEKQMVMHVALPILAGHEMTVSTRTFVASFAVLHALADALGAPDPWLPAARAAGSSVP